MMSAVAMRRDALIAVLATLVLPATAFAERVCADAKLCVETKRNGDAIDFFAINPTKALPISGKLTLEMTNMRVTKGGNRPFVIEGGERRFLFTIAQSQKSKAWRYNYRFYWARGDFTAAHDDSQRYRLPFASGDAYRVSQGCNGTFSHSDSSRYAVDFDMPENSPVHAARGGRVVEVRSDSDRGGPSKIFKEDANKVYIQHSDRTLGLYYHFRKNGPTVSIGDVVEAGDLIGYSGNTGWSSGPHLHFEVTRANDDITEDTSIRIAFQTGNGPISCPPKGRMLRRR